MEYGHHLANTLSPCLDEEQGSKIIHIHMEQVTIYIYGIALRLRYGPFGSYRTSP